MSLEIILGCMYSGKSTEVMRRINRYKVLKKEVMIINNQLDTRYTDGLTGYIATHDKIKTSCISAKILLTLVDTQSFREADVIIVEEAQFFGDLFEFVVNSIDKYNKYVIVSGLSGDSNKKPFGQIIDLIPHAEKITKLSALCLECNDGTEAHFSKRISNKSQNQVLVGSDGDYIAVCRRHFNS